MFDLDAATQWFLLTGALFVVMALTGSVLKRLPLSSAIVYLLVGFGIGSHGLGLLHLEAVKNARLVERISEVAVLISLFTAGLKLRAPLRDGVWRPALSLATLGMAITVLLLAMAGHLLLGLPVWAAMFLGAVLAPTDPVLASEVQARDPNDADRVRFSLTGEAGLNDGTAFPFVMLALGLGGMHELGAFGWRWVAVDVLWATFGGLAIGALLGVAVARLVVYLRKKHREAVGLDDFVALGLVALSYGAALAVHAYGFLAVFAAGLALRREERVSSGESGEQVENNAKPEAFDPERDEPMESGTPGLPDIENEAAAATDPERAPAYMAQAVLEFNEGLERVTEVAIVVMLGAMLSLSMLTWQAALLAVLLFLVIRPAAAFYCLKSSSLQKPQRRLITWFGIRGIGSIYYLTFGLSHGAHTSAGEQVAQLVLPIVAVSIVVHGITVSPLMTHYEKWQRRHS